MLESGGDDRRSHGDLLGLFTALDRHFEGADFACDGGQRGAETDIDIGIVLDRRSHLGHLFPGVAEVWRQGGVPGEFRIATEGVALFDQYGLVAQVGDAAHGFHARRPSADDENRGLTHRSPPMSGIPFRRS